MNNKRLGRHAGIYMQAVFVAHHVEMSKYFSLLRLNHICDSLVSVFICKIKPQFKKYPPFSTIISHLEINCIRCHRHNISTLLALSCDHQGFWDTQNKQHMVLNSPASGSAAHLQHHLPFQSCFNNYSRHPHDLSKDQESVISAEKGTEKTLFSLRHQNVAETSMSHKLVVTCLNGRCPEEVKALLMQ